MAERSLATMLEESHGLVKRLRGHVEKHKGAISAVTTEVVSAVEGTIGGVGAAALDYFLGDNTSSGIPEFSIGPVPVVASVAVAAKLGAIALALGERSDAMPMERTSHHVGRLADALLSGEAALTGMRMLLDSKMRQIPAAPTAQAA